MALNEPALTVRIGRAPLSLHEASECFLVDCQARNLSPHTLSLNRVILRSLVDDLGNAPLPDVAPDSLRRFFINKASATSPATAARYYNCIHRLFNFLMEEEFIESNPMKAVRRPQAPAPLIQPLSQAQVEAMIATCGKTFSGQRNRLVLLILVDCGLRASELCSLTLADVDLDNQQFLVRHGKGDRARRVPFGGAVLGVLRQYLIRRADVESPNLIVNVYGDAVNRYRIRAIVQDAAARAEVTHPHMGPHLLRHTCAVQYLRNGGDTFSLQKVLGHATLVMTRRYSELTDTDISDKHRLFSPADRLNAAATNTGKRRMLK